MSVVALIFTPIVLLYQGWTYHVFRAPAAAGRQDARGEPAAAAARECRARSRPAPRPPRAGGAARCSRVDAALGVAAALLVLAQAVLLARVVARAFDGASLGDVDAPLVLLVAVVAARAAAAWGFEVVGRRAATGVLSQLRLDLVEQRLRDQPAALDGARERGGRDDRRRRRRRARDDVRALPAAGRARRRRAGRGARARRVDRSSSRPA